MRMFKIIFNLFFFNAQDLQLFDKIDWVGNGPPISEPHCGFRGEKCISKLLIIIKSVFMCTQHMLGHNQRHCSQ